jgi:hypothetical protein
MSPGILFYAVSGIVFLALLVLLFIYQDRRFVFALMALAVIVPLLQPFALPGIAVSPEVKGLYKKIDSMPPGSTLLLSFDFDPASKPELYPMAVCILRHAFSRDIKVVAMGLWLPGTGIAEEIMGRMAREAGKTKWEDYVYLGWAPGTFNVIIGLGQDLYKTFPKDYYGRDTREIPLLKKKNLGTLAKFDYVVCLAAGDPGIETWLIYGQEKHQFEMGGGCTSVIAPKMYAFLRSGQLNGLLGGMKGAAEYESLLNKPGLGIRGMDAQSTTHFLIIILILISNILYFATRKK